LSLHSNLSREAKRLATALQAKKLKIVFAESCTAGLAAATLARIPGISDRLCGSAVVYRDDTKSKWLGIPAAKIRKYGAASPEIAKAMSLAVLTMTPEANLAVSITGHLGPSPENPSQEGIVMIGLAIRNPRRIQVLTIHLLKKQRSSPRVRLQRQILAASTALRAAALFTA